jgi:hypothetical protein
MYNVMYTGGRAVAMVRKQLYLERQHDERLKTLARASGRSEADLVREAVERYGTGTSVDVAPDPRAWQEAVAFMRSLTRRRRAGRPHAASRQQVYEEGLARRGSRAR